MWLPVNLSVSFGALDAAGRRAGNGVRGSEAAAEARDGAPGRLPEENQVTDGDPTWARAAETWAEGLHTQSAPWTEGKIGDKNATRCCNS